MESLKGHFLLAGPSLLDPNFFRTVVLLVEHNESGALGLVLNRPTSTPLGQAWKEVSETPCIDESVLYCGGPCPGPLMALHSEAALMNIEVAPGLYFSQTPETLEGLVSQSSDARFFVGFSGWGPSQLEGELDEGAWLASPAAVEEVFGDPEALWQQLLRAISNDTILGALGIKHVPEDPSMN